MKKKIDNVLRVLWLLVLPLGMSLWLLMLMLYEYDFLEFERWFIPIYEIGCYIFPISWLLGFTINTLICFYKDFKRRKNND